MVPRPAPRRAGTRAAPDDAIPDSPRQVRLLQQMQAQQMLVQQARPEASHARLVQQPEPAPRAGSFDDSTVARVLQDLKEDSPTHSGDGARLDPDSEDEAAEACRAAREEQRGALASDRDPARDPHPHPRSKRGTPRDENTIRARPSVADSDSAGGRRTDVKNLLFSSPPPPPPGIEPPTSPPPRVPSPL